MNWLTYERSALTMITRRITPDECFLRDTNISTQEEHDQLEWRTRGQRSKKTWRHERMKHLHSSNYGRICTTTETTDLAKLARSFTRPKLSSSAPTNYGKKYKKPWMSIPWRQVPQSDIVGVRSAVPALSLVVHLTV